MLNRENLVRLSILLLGFGAASLTAAQTCQVPSPAYPTIQTAIDAPVCSPISVAAGIFEESPVINRSLTLEGNGSSETFIQGGLRVTNGTVALAGLHLSAAQDALTASSGAEVTGFDLKVVSGFVATPIFADDFEDGTTGAWTTVFP